MMERQRIGASIVAISLREMSWGLTQTRRRLESSIAFVFSERLAPLLRYVHPSGSFWLAISLRSVRQSERATLLCSKDALGRLAGQL